MRRSFNLEPLFIMILPVLILSWRIHTINYETGDFDLLVSSSTMLTVLSITALGMLTIISLISKETNKRIRSFIFIGYLIVSYLAPYLANYPHFVHRDVFLHLPYSFVMVDLGHIPSIGAERYDVNSFPASFVFYAIYIAITKFNVLEAGINMAVLYTLLLYMMLLILSKALLRGSESFIPIAMLILPFISRYAPSPEFPHRYHLAFSMTLLWLVLYLRLRALHSYANLFGLAVLTQAIIFTHPYFSTFLLIFVTSEFLISIITRRHSQEFSRRAMISSLVITSFLTHVAYITSPSFLIEAYRISTTPIFLPKFIEASIPVTLETTSTAIILASLFVRWSWRITLLLIVVTAVATYLLLPIKYRVRVEPYPLLLAIAAILISFPLVNSFLWWDRSLTFIGIATLFMLGEGLRSININKNGYSNRLLHLISMALIVLSIFISPLAKWERQVMPDNWQGSEKLVFLSVISTRLDTPSIFLGIVTAVEYTYFKVYLYADLNPPNARTIYDVINSKFSLDPRNAYLPYALSIRDVDYSFIDLNEMFTAKSLIYSSNASFIVI